MSLDVFKYETNEAFALNSNMQVDMLWYLDRLYNDMNAIRFKNPIYYQKLYQEYIGIQRFLEFLGIYAEIGWAGHRKNHFFPNGEDAEMELDWQQQCAEEGDLDD